MRQAIMLSGTNNKIKKLKGNKYAMSVLMSHVDKFFIIISSLIYLVLAIVTPYPSVRHNMIP